MPGPFDSQLFDAALAPFYDTPVAFHGERAGARPVDLTVKCTIIEDSSTAPGDAVAPTRERTFNIAFPRSHWREATPPQIGEWVHFRWAGEEIMAKVEQVGRMPDGDFTLTATWSPEQKGGPSWLA